LNAVGTETWAWGERYRYGLHPVEGGSMEPRNVCILP